MSKPIVRNGRTYLTIGTYARRHRISRYQAEKIWALAKPDGAFQDATHAYIPADVEPWPKRPGEEHG
jgi:hypothetical protein